MFKPFYAFIGYRYARVKRKNHFISFISLTSMLGIALGITVLITVLSVMNGFRKEIRAQMLSVTPHITVRDFNNNFVNWREVLQTLRVQPEVIGSAPYVAGHGLLLVGGNVAPSIVRGVDPHEIEAVYPLEKNIISGNLFNLTDKSFTVALGMELAQNLGVQVGDKLTLMVPEATVSLAGAMPRMKRLTVVAIYDTGTFYDNKHIFMHIKDAQRLYKLNAAITGIQIRIKDELQSPEIALKLAVALNNDYWVSNWTREFGNFFEAIKMEKTVMTCILFLIIAVAAFNLISSLVMVVTDKRKDIAILRVMGARKRDIMAIFFVQGAWIGLVGTILGLIFGLLLAYNVTELVEMLQRLFDVQFISKDVYFIGHVPSDIQSMDVILVVIGSVLLSLGATIYPALRTTKILPAEALRYE